MVSTFVAPQLPPTPKNVETRFDLCCHAFAFIVACRDKEISSDVEIQDMITHVWSTSAFYMEKHTMYAEVCVCRGVYLPVT